MAPYLPLPTSPSLATDEPCLSPPPPPPLSDSTKTRFRRVHIVVAFVVLSVLAVAAAGVVVSPLNGSEVLAKGRKMLFAVPVAVEEVEGVEKEAEGKWKTTAEEDRLRNWRWMAEVDPSLSKAVEGLSENDLATREWLRTSRPLAAQGSTVGYAAVEPFAPVRIGESKVEGRGGPGEFEGGDESKYNDLLDEWRTGQKTRSVGEWEESYARLHAEILAGEKEARLIESWWSEGPPGGGLADRLLGSVTVFLLALLTERAFLTTWDSPVPLSLLFDSPSIDWSGPASAFPSIPSLPASETGWPLHPVFDNGTLLEGRRAEEVHNLYEPEMVELSERVRKGDLAEEAWLRLDTPNRGWAIHAFTTDATVSARLYDLGMTLETAYSQLLHFLFRPKLETMMFIDQYSSVFALPSVFAVGIQVRTGDMFMANPKLDVLNTVERHQHFFDCAAEVVETYALPGQRPLYFLISDSANLRRDALSTYPDRIVISGLEQHHNELDRKQHNKDLLKTAASSPPATDDDATDEMISQLSGFHNTVAESWIFADMDFALLSAVSGFGRIPTWAHGKPNRAIEVPRIKSNKKDPKKFSKVKMPSCALASTLTSFEDLAGTWSLG